MFCTTENMCKCFYFISALHLSDLINLLHMSGNLFKTRIFFK